MSMRQPVIRDHRPLLGLVVTLAFAGCTPKADTVPSVAGERLDVAIDSVEDAGLDHEEIGGGIFGIIQESRWVVCDQRPEAGSSTEGIDSVKLIVDRKCDAVSGSEGGRMPNVEGERLDVAKLDLTEAGIGYRISGGGIFGVVEESRWTVCKAKPAAGKPTAQAVLYIRRAC